MHFWCHLLSASPHHLLGRNIPLIFLLFPVYFKECFFSISFYVFCRSHLISFFDFSLFMPINSSDFFVLFLGNRAKLPDFFFPTGRAVPSAAFVWPMRFVLCHLTNLVSCWNFFLSLLIKSYAGELVKLQPCNLTNE